MSLFARRQLLVSPVGVEIRDAADFFRSRLDKRICLRHPLALLASPRPWQEIEASIAHPVTNKVRA